jgi:hypothetical protein
MNLPTKNLLATPDAFPQGIPEAWPKRHWQN